MTEKTPKPSARELNKIIRYTMWSVFRVSEPLGDADRGPVTDEVFELVERSPRRTSSSAASTTSPACGPTRTS